MQEELKEKIKKKIVESVTDLEEERTLALVKKALKGGVEMEEITQCLQEGMDKVGELFEDEEYFIGDLIMAGIIFKEVLKLDLKHGLVSSGNDDCRGVILIGTVHGDIHDIGKDIFIGMACVNGFKVVDLGVDVPNEVFIEKIKEISPNILGLSGLISEASRQVRSLLEQIYDEGLREGMKIIVGGGLMRRENETPKAYADAYVKNSQRGLNYCLEWARNGYK